MMAEDPFSFEKVSQEFKRRGLEIKDAQQVQRVTGLVINLHNHTRVHINRGHTPAELFKTEKLYLRALPKAVGRNEPCICGSGKKSKKCCGR